MPRGVATHIDPINEVRQVAEDIKQATDISLWHDLLGSPHTHKVFNGPTTPEGAASVDPDAVATASGNSGRAS